jgi:hypothetical protein
MKNETVEMMSVNNPTIVGLVKAVARDEAPDLIPNILVKRTIVAPQKISLEERSARSGFPWLLF